MFTYPNDPKRYHVGYIDPEQRAITDIREEITKIFTEQVGKEVTWTELKGSAYFTEKEKIPQESPESV